MASEKSRHRWNANEEAEVGEEEEEEEDPLAYLLEMVYRRRQTRDGDRLDSSVL